MAESYSIYKNHLKKNKQMTFIYSELSMLGSQLLSTAFHRLKEGSRVGKLDSLKNVWGGFRDILIGSCWHREVGGRARNGTSYVTGFRNISGFFCLVLSWKEVLKRGREMNLIRVGGKCLHLVHNYDLFCPSRVISHTLATRTRRLGTYSFMI